MKHPADCTNSGVLLIYRVKIDNYTVCIRVRVRVCAGMRAGGCALVCVGVCVLGYK